MELLTSNDYKAIDTSSLVDKVERNLVELFVEKGFKVGDSIPKELELSEALGVSRTVIREALLRLRMMGLIDSKKKRGAVLTSPDLVSILGKSMNPKVLDESTLKEIFEMTAFAGDRNGRLYYAKGNETGY